MRENWIDSQSDNPFFQSRPCAPQAAPPQFLRHQFRKTWVVPGTRDKVWNWLNDPATFTDGQVPPYRVEFVSAEVGVPRGFEVGGLNSHHGPLLLASGTLVEIREQEYRDLQYFYGSYVISLRLVRPTRLQFWVEQHGPDSVKVTVQLDSFVRGWFEPFWQVGQRAFWWGFGRWLRGAVGRGVGGST